MGRSARSHDPSRVRRPRIPRPQPLPLHEHAVRDPRVVQNLPREAHRLRARDGFNVRDGDSLRAVPYKAMSGWS